MPEVTNKAKKLVPLPASVAAVGAFLVMGGILFSAGSNGAGEMPVASLAPLGTHRGVRAAIWCSPR